MCGIAGYICKEKYQENVIVKMTDRIRHRGPDSCKHYIDGNVGLGFVRLSILDLSDKGSQPMTNEDESLVLLFNGEIYNFREIKEDLIEKGHIFKTMTDSEVILHGYAQYGKEVVSKLRGMFAFVIYDKNNDRLFGARDHFGIKPFYYYEKNGDFMFASEIKAFLDHPAFEKELNEERLPDFMTFGCLPGEDTFFLNVKKLLPGHCLCYEGGKLTIEKYWEATFEPDESKTIEELADQLDQVIGESVDKHIIADVPVCSFLSGGVDSSYVANELKDKVDLSTFTIDFEDKKYSEAPNAGRFAEDIGVKNSRREVNEREYFEDAKKVQYHMDEPLGNPSANLLYYLSKHVSKEYKVALSGEGADEMFGGYNIYNEVISLSKYQKIPKPVRRGLAGVAKRLPNFKGKNFLIRGSKDVEERYIGNSNVFKYEERDGYLKKKYPSRNPLDIAAEYYAKVQSQGDVTKMQYVDINMWLRQEILLKADKMSMANSLELRVPFMDIKVFEAARIIPDKHKVTKENTKVAFRYLADRKLPKESAQRIKEMFPSPLPQWMRLDECYNMIREKFESSICDQFFNRKKMLDMLEKHREGNVTYAIKIWLVLTFILWYEVYFIDNQ